MRNMLRLLKHLILKVLKTLTVLVIIFIAHVDLYGMIPGNYVAMAIITLGFFIVMIDKPLIQNLKLGKGIKVPLEVVVLDDIIALLIVAKTITLLVVMDVAVNVTIAIYMAHRIIIITIRVMDTIIRLIIIIIMITIIIIIIIMTATQLIVINAVESVFAARDVIMNANSVAEDWTNVVIP